ncbi:MAG: FAD-dependent oxidoreductase [Pseudomonadota bacterium]
MTNMKYVIIGASAAGMSATRAIRKYDPDSIIRIISDESTPPYSRIFLPKLITGEVNLADILMRTEEQIQRLWIKLIKCVAVNSIHSEIKMLQMNNGARIEYDKLLIAAGASPKLPQIKGVALPGVFGFRNLQDAGEIRTGAEHCQRVVIIGGGLVSLKAAEALNHFDLDVHIVVRSPQLLSQMLDQESAQLVLQKVLTQGITVHFGLEVVAISGKNRVEGVVLDNGRKISCQMVIVGKGVQSNLTFLKGSGLKTDKGILVDPHQHTNRADIYAAGDIAQTPDFFKAGHSIKALWPNAVQQGKIAGMNMAGKEIVNPDEISANIVNLFGLNLASCGLIKKMNAADDEIVFQNANVFRKLVFHNNVVVGAVLLGEVHHIGILRALILIKKNVADKKNLLIDRSFKFASLMERSL